MMHDTKRFMRVREGKVIGGVTTGIAHYFGIDPVVVRLALIFLFVATGFVPLMVAYIAAVMCVPYGSDDPA
jgi:phage shock protein C